MRATKPYKVSLSDEQFKLLWDAFPHDEDLIAAACDEAYWKIRVPNSEGVWTRFGARVYKDQYGFHASGYRMVHWEDYAKVPGCLSNGYTTDKRLYDDSEIEWDPEIEAEQQKALDIRRTLAEWMR